MGQTALVKPNEFRQAISAENFKARVTSALPVAFRQNVERLLTTASLYYADHETLWECTPESKYTAIAECAQLGLDFNKVKGQGALIAYGKTCTFMPMWKGLRDLALRDGKIVKIKARIVHQKDKFTLVEGLRDDIIHIPEIKEHPGPVIGAYAIAYFADGNAQSEFMRLDELEQVRKSSKRPNVGPWRDWRESMYKKSAIRRLCNQLPMSEELAKAIELDNKALFDDKDMEVAAETIPPLEIEEAVPEADTDPEPETAPTPEPPAPVEKPKAKTKPKPKAVEPGPVPESTPPMEEPPPDDNIAKAEYTEKPEQISAIDDLF